MNFIRSLGILILSAAICCFPFSTWNGVKQEKHLNGINHIYVDSDWVAEDAYNKLILARKNKKNKK